MSVNIGGIDIAEGIINAEYRIGVLERVIERLLRAAPPGTLSDQELAKIRQESTEALKLKYPAAGISQKPKQ